MSRVPVVERALQLQSIINPGISRFNPGKHDNFAIHFLLKKNRLYIDWVFPLRELYYKDRQQRSLLLLLYQQATDPAKYANYFRFILCV
jgi:hypothetical protein